MLRAMTKYEGRGAPTAVFLVKSMARGFRRVGLGSGVTIALDGLSSRLATRSGSNPP